jgi:thiosulfate reductase/polysulfide reductase chain A
MQIEVSRRKFLQGSVALSIIGGSAVTAPNLFSSEKENSPLRLNTKTANVDAQKIATICEICVNKCAAIARVENGVVTKLDPNPLFPKSKNMLCARGNAGIQSLYDPDRLKYPMIREGKRGEGKFRRVTWDEAYEYIKDHTLKILDEEKDNRSSFCFCAGEGMAEHTFKNFFTAFGSSNWLNHASLCLQTAVSAYGITIGGYGQADLENAEYIIMAGANRAEAIVTPDTMDLFKRTKRRGAKLIVIDPRFTNTAAKADRWLPINVGTDLALVLALTHVAISEEIYNKAYVETMFNGFDDYKNHIIGKDYTPEWAQRITGIAADEIRKMAREFMAAAPKAVYYQGRRTTFSKNDFQLRRAMAIFSALGGGIDTKGGIIFGGKLPLAEHDSIAPMYERAQGRAVSKKEKLVKGEAGYEDCAIVTGGGSWIKWRNRFLEGRMPYNVRGMFIYKHNPMQNMPNTLKTREMFEKLDLVVAIDTLPSDTVMMADVVLPECTYLERTDPVKTFAGPVPAIAQRNKVIDPMYESKPVMDIMRGITEKLSKPMFEITKKYDEEVQEAIEDEGEEEVYAEYDITLPFAHSQEELNEHAVHAYHGAAEILKEKGIFYPDMDKHFKQLGANDFEYLPENQKKYSVKNGKLATASGKVECNFSNLTDKGVDAMPTWKDEYEFKVPDGKFRLITGRHAQMTQTGTANNAMLLDFLPENFIWINKRVAKEKNIEFGDAVEVSSSIGKTVLKAYPTEKIGPQVVFFIHGYGMESDGLTLANANGGNDNAVIEDVTEPVYGAAAMHETNVEIKKV